jgi:hypothetical protein
VTLTERAEKALLGAVLLGADPSAVLPRLAHEDFAYEVHRSLFTLIEQASPSRAGWTVAPGADPAVSRDYLNDVKQACPDPDHASAYARMVIEAGLRRQLAAHALRLEHAAGDLHYQARRLAEVTSPGDTAEDLLKRALRTETGHTEPSLERLLGHELLVSLALRAHVKAFDPGRESPLPAPPEEPGPGNGLAMISSSPAALWDAAIQPPVPRRDTDAEREEHVLASLIRQHPETSDVPGWLPAEAFTSPARREIFTAIVRLHRRGEPVDELTADWERARHQATTPDAPRPDTSYAQRLACLPVHPAEALAASRALLNDFENSQDTSKQRTGSGPSIDGLTGPITRLPDLAPGNLPLLQPPPGASGTPGPQPRM